MKKTIFIILAVIFPAQLFSQGMNNTWLLGNDPGWPNIGRIVFDANSYQLLTETRKMAFKGTQATISDNQGNFLMSSNGVWIANATNDTMMNGSGLNPGYFVNGWLNGLPIISGNIFLPYPGDNSKYILFHQTELDQSSTYQGIYKSVIDITLDSGFGAVTQKNDTIKLDSLSWGITACRHANGRDWWVVFLQDQSDSIHKVLQSNIGIHSNTTQSLQYTPYQFSNGSQLTFSPDGTKFITTTYDNPIDRNSYLVISNFDRCTGMFSGTQTLHLTSGSYLWGLAFSPSGEFIYACNSQYVFQINSNTLSVDTVAVYDGFISGFPPNCCATSFWNMFLAANGKIYITSGSSVQHLHEMNFPDSAGIACDVQQHTIALGNYFHLRAVPNHPNYYLGALTGSPCDTLTSSFELQEHDFRFSVSPNPNNGDFKIMYLLPQNHTSTSSVGQKGKLEVFDVNGRKVYEMNLPQWSTMQYVSIPKLANGVYNAVISSGDIRMNKKIVVLNE
jgi:hypothetical protein